MKNPHRHLMLSLACALLLPSAALATTATRSSFGSMPDGSKVEAVKLQNGHGTSVTVIAYGARVQSLITPDRNGKLADVALGYNTMDGYLSKRQFFGATVGGVLSLWRLRTRGILTGAAAGVLAIVAFALLATAGLSILTRYLLFPATLLAIFAAAGICAWVELPRTDPWRNRWMALGALTVVGLLVFVPSQLTRLRNTRHALIAQTHILNELHDMAVDNLPADKSCAVWVPNRRAVPQLALWTDRRPTQIRSAQEEHRYGLPAFVPRTRAIASCWPR